jgi:nitrous oxide reductase accessory protein NosL
MRTTVVVLLLFLAVGMPWGVAGESKTNTICQLCGMDAAKSETEFIVYRKTEPEMHACCINCARRIMKKLGTEVTSVTALDYRTRKHVPAADAFYLKGSKTIPKGSMTPFVLAFGAKDDAEAFKEKYGGTIYTFQNILEELNKTKTGMDASPASPTPGQHH